MMNDNVIVVGGGNAGCISALILKSTFPEKNISIIKSKDIGTVGVGESSTEHFSEFCKTCGIPILELILRAKATFKNGVYFKDWSDEDFLHNININSVSSTTGHHFPYMQQVVANNRPNYEMNHNGSWDNRIRLSFFNDLNHSPTNQFHFDTHALNNFLSEICLRWGINIIEDELVGAILDSNNGNIASLNGKDKKYDADFFIDCSGFSRLLLGKTLGVKWKSYSEYLPLNSAIAFATEEMDEYNIYTKSTARDYGWSWQIPTQGRTGNGYVFCDRFIDEDQAHQEMEKVYNQKLDVAKTFKFDPGRMENAWYKNCYAVGLSQSFVEPLEATAIGSVIQQMYAFIHFFPSNNIDECNKVVNDIFDNIFDYVQAHYLVKREDTPFWKEIKNDLKIKPSLQKLLDVWEKRFPLAQDIVCKWGMFTELNYIPILYGLKWFDQKSVSEQYKNISDIPILNWERSYKSDILYVGHKNIIKEIVRISNLNRKKY